MSGMTSDRLEELRRIAEAATPGPWRIPGANVFRVVAPETQNQGDPYYRWAVIADADPRSVDGEQAAANACYIAAFHPPTVLAMLDEIERLRREREKLAEAVRAMKYFFDSDYSDPEESATANWSYAHQKWLEALALLDGAKGRVMDRGQDENDFIPPEQVDTGCPICGEPRLWCWCDGEKGGDGAS